MARALAVPRAAPWVAVGETAAAALARALPASTPPETALDVPAAILALGLDGRRPTLVTFDALGKRAKDALAALAEAAAPEAVLLLADAAGPIPPRVRRAAAALGVACVASAEEALHGAPPPPARERRAAAAPTAPEAPPPRRARRVLPREEAPATVERRRGARGGRTGGGTSDAGFLDGCFRRLDRPEALCRFLLATMVRATRARRASLLLLDANRSSLFLKAARGLDEALVGRLRTPLSSGLAGRATSLGRALVGRAPAGGERGYEGTAYALFPLGKGRRCEGVIALTDLPGDALPDGATLRMLRRRAARAGRAISAARRLEHAEVLSATDDLTSLPNRRSFERALHRELERARRAGTPLAVALFDVDHFKSLNDRFGHPVGDRALAQVARRLQEALRETDLVCRFGGEEFAVLLTGLADGSADEALAVLERARRAVADRPLSLGPGLPCPMVTVSGGFARFPTDATDSQALVARADAVLYEAKRGGRDRVLHA